MNERATVDSVKSLRDVELLLQGIDDVSELETVQQLKAIDGELRRLLSNRDHDQQGAELLAELRQLAAELQRVA